MPSAAGSCCLPRSESLATHNAHWLHACGQLGMGAQAAAGAPPLPAAAAPEQLASGSNLTSPGCQILCILPGALVRVPGSGRYAQGMQVGGVLRMQGTAAAATDPVTSSSRRHRGRHTGPCA